MRNEIRDKNRDRSYLSLLRVNPAKGVIKMLKFFGIAGGIILIYLVAIIIVQGPVTAFREIIYRKPGLDTLGRFFPARTVLNSKPVSELVYGSSKNFPVLVTFRYNGVLRTEPLKDLLAETKTKAFVVIRNDQIIYESYLNGARRDSLNISWSVAKSVTSALMGIAIDEGKIGSINDAVIRYVPELKSHGFDKLTIRDLLTMSSGIRYYDIEDNIFFLAIAFEEGSRQTYGPDLRQQLLNLVKSDYPVGKYFQYNDYNSLLEGLILERVTGGHVSDYLQEKLWKPMGMEYSAAWTLDNEKDGFEKVNCALNAGAVDFARFGLLYLHRGFWNGKRIISEKWISESTEPDPNDKRPWKNYIRWRNAGGFYKYHWWGLQFPDGTYDFMALGVLGQVIYVSPRHNTVVVRFGEEPDPRIIWPMIIHSLVKSIPQ